MSKSLTNDLLIKIVDQIVEDPKVKPNCCGCSNCGWHGPISECEEEIECDGPFPEGICYTIHLCPNCDDGCIDNYWYDESIDK